MWGMMDLRIDEFLIPTSLFEEAFFNALLEGNQGIVQMLNERHSARHLLWEYIDELQDKALTLWQVHWSCPLF